MPDRAAGENQKSKSRQDKYSKEPESSAVKGVSREAVRSTLDGADGQPPIIALRDRVHTDAIPLLA